MGVIHSQQYNIKVRLLGTYLCKLYALFMHKASFIWVTWVYVCICVCLCVFASLCMWLDVSMYVCEQSTRMCMRMNVYVVCVRVYVCYVCSRDCVCVWMFPCMSVSSLLVCGCV